MQTFVLLLLFTVAWPGAEDLSTPLDALRAVGPNGAGHQAAAAAWPKLAAASPDQLPALLAALDGANPLAANWIGSAVDAVIERAEKEGRSLPNRAIEAFVLDRQHDPHGRRLAYEVLVRSDPATPDRLLPGMTDDPSLELRRDAVAKLIAAAEAREKREATREALMADYKTALTAARDLDQIKLVSDKLKSFGEKVDLPRHFGLIVAWRVDGPFDNTAGRGFDAVYAPEKEINFAATFDGKHGPVRWIEHKTADDYGQVNLNKALAEEKAVVAYAAAEFNAEREQPVEIRYASFNATKLWLNGKLLADHRVYHGGMQFDQYVTRVTLPAGRNTILLKVCQNEQTQEWARAWGFQLRVCDAAGGAVLSKERE